MDQPTDPSDIVHAAAELHGIAYSMASFIAAIDSDSSRVARYIEQRLTPLLAVGLVSPEASRALLDVLKQIGQDGRTG